jgi:hypothetical protein
VQPYLRPHTGQEDADADRLGDVVVGAGVERQYLVGAGIAAADHDDRAADALAPHQPAQLRPVHVAKLDLKQDGVEIIVQDGVERGGAESEFLGLELRMQPQLGRQVAAASSVAVDDQEFSLSAHSRLYPRRPLRRVQSSGPPASPEYTTHHICVLRV